MISVSQEQKELLNRHGVMAIEFKRWANHEHGAHTSRMALDFMAGGIYENPCLTIERLRKELVDDALARYEWGMNCGRLFIGEDGKDEEIIRG